MMSSLLLILLAASLFTLWRVSSQKRRLLNQLEAGLERLAQSDFAVTLDEKSAGTLNGLVRRLNELSSTLRARQRSAQQSEQLRYTLMDNAPMAILLLEDTGNIEFANQSAKELFFSGQNLSGTNFLSLLAEAQPTLRRRNGNLPSCEAPLRIGRQSSHSSHGKTPDA